MRNCENRNVVHRVGFKFTALVIILILSVVGCQSAKRKKDEQQIIPSESESRVGRELTRNLDQAYGAWNDSRVEQLLNEMIAKIASADPVYKFSVSDARVHLLATSTPLMAAGLGRTVYLSRGLLESVSYENELAYLLGVQLALLKEGSTKENLATLQGQSVGENLVVLPTTPLEDAGDFIKGKWFEPGGLFDLGNDAYLRSEKDAVGLIYKAAYDPRGAVTLIQRWDAPKERQKYRVLGKILPEVEDRLRQAREEVAKLSPLRDPIVRSVAFQELSGHLHIKKAKQKKNGH